MIKVLTEPAESSNRTKVLYSPFWSISTSAKLLTSFESDDICCHSLLEDLTVSPLVRLAVVLDRLIPCPHALDELLVLGLGGVELGELVRLEVRGNVEGRKGLLATDDESTTDGRVVGNTVDGSASEEVLAGSLKTVEETTDLVVAHERHGELVVVLEVDAVKRVLVEVGVLPEPGKGNLAGLLVGVLALPVVKDEGSLGKSLKRVLGTGGGGGLLLLVLNLLGLRGSLGLLGLGGSLLLWGLVGDGLLDELELLVDNLRVDALVGDGLVPTGDVGVLAAPLLVEEELEATGDEASSEEISKSETLADEVGVDEEVVLEGLDGLVGGLLAVLDALLVVGVTADERTEPATESGEDLSVGVRHPPQNGGVVLLGLAEEGGLLVLGSDC